MFTVPAKTSTLRALGFMARDHLSAIAVVDEYVAHYVVACGAMYH